MSKHARDRRPYYRPVEKITLQDGNLRLRWILVVVLVIIAAGAIGLGVHYALQVEPGWNRVETGCDEPNYSSEVQLMYDFSVDPGNATAINKALSTLYSQIMEDAYRLFSKEADVQGVRNLFYLNQHINEKVSVEPELYEALALLKKYDSRCIFLAPVYTEYNRVMAAETDVEAEMYDPAKDSEAGKYIDQLMTFISDPAMVEIQLLEDNQVIVQVGQGYLDFARENDITDFLDFGWLRNAFVVDYASDILLEKGFADGYLTSYDGFTRSLSEATQDLNLNLYDRVGTDIYWPGKMTYSGRKTVVSLRDFPLSTAERWNYHVYEDGSIASVMVEPDTGRNIGAVSNLVGYSEVIGCAELVLELIPIYFGEETTVQGAERVQEKEIHTVWCSDGAINHTEAALDITVQENQDGMTYKISYQGK